jgi:hypothetical protein
MHWQIAEYTPGEKQMVKLSILFPKRDLSILLEWVFSSYAWQTPVALGGEDVQK